MLPCASCPRELQIFPWRGLYRLSVLAFFPQLMWISLAFRNSLRPTHIETTNRKVFPLWQLCILKYFYLFYVCFSVCIAYECVLMFGARGTESQAASSVVFLRQGLSLNQKLIHWLDQQTDWWVTGIWSACLCQLPAGGSPTHTTIFGFCVPSGSLDSAILFEWQTPAHFLSQVFVL